MDTQAPLPYLTVNARKLFRLAGETRAKPKSGHVHDLRVTTRKIRALLRLLPEESYGRNLKTLKRQLRKLARATGDRRDADVAIADAEAYGLESSELRKQRKDSRDNLEDRLRAARICQLKGRLNQLFRDMRESPLPNSGISLKPVLSKLKQVNTSAMTKRRTLHRLRIEIKNARYALEAFGVNSPKLQDLQHRLGRTHDLETLRSLLSATENAAGKLALKKIGKDADAEVERARKIMDPAIQVALRRLTRIARLGKQ